VTVTIVAVASVKGTGGVTATALGLAALGHEMCGDAMLIEADPSGGSLLGWSEHLHAGRTALYEAITDGDIGRGMQRLGNVRVLPAQGDPWKVTVALENVRNWRRLLEPAGELAVVDVGRLYPGSPVSRIVGEADVIVLVAPAEAAPIAATLQWASRGGRRGVADPVFDAGRMRLVTVDVSKGRRSGVDPRSLVRDDLGIAYAGHVPFDEAALSLLCRGSGTTHRSINRSKLVYAHRALAGNVLGDRIGAQR